MIYLLTDNIFFSSKIAHNLKANGLEVRTFTAPDGMRAALAEDQPAAILINLNAQRYDPPEVIRALKIEGIPAVIVAFCGHSDKATYQKGLESGADRVVANSAITMNAVQALRDASVNIEQPG